MNIKNHMIVEDWCGGLFQINWSEIASVRKWPVT